MEALLFHELKHLRKGEDDAVKLTGHIIEIVHEDEVRLYPDWRPAMIDMRRTFVQLELPLPPAQPTVPEALKALEAAGAVVRVGAAGTTVEIHLP